MIKHITISLLLCLTILISFESSASGMVKLRDYDEARRADDFTNIALLRSYILGAVETHLLYSVILKDVVGGNLFCTGDVDLNINELGTLFEAKIIALRREYGEEIMDMPIAKAVQLVVEEQYKCD